MKPRAMVGLVLIAACCIAGWYVYRQTTKDPGLLIGFAIGNQNEGEVELHVVVSMGMVKTEGLRMIMLSDGAISRQTWGEWIAEHFDVRNDAGEKVRMRKGGWSDLISERKANNPEFYVVGRLRVGAHYTFDYVPRRASNVHHRHSFTALAEGAPFERLYFETVYVDVP